MPPGDYFIDHLPLIRKAVFHGLIVKGYYRRDQMDELVQKISELLLIREKNILGLYKGKAKFSTYLTAVVENMCREIRNAEKSRRYRFVSFSDIIDFSKVTGWLNTRRGSAISPSQKLMIDDAVTRLDTILRTYPAERARLEFCLKAVFRIPIHPDDLKHSFITDDMAVMIRPHIDALNDRDRCKTKTQVYERLTAVFFILQKKDNTGDAIRKWIGDRMSDLIFLLNGDPPEYSFDRETFQYLFDYYCKNRPAEFQKITHNQSNK